MGQKCKFLYETEKKSNKSFSFIKFHIFCSSTSKSAQNVASFSFQAKDKNLFNFQLLHFGAYKCNGKLLES